jgi:hypothetical protein
MKIIATLIFLGDGILVVGVLLFAASTDGNGNMGDGIQACLLGVAALVVLTVTLPVGGALMWFSKRRDSNKALDNEKENTT